MIPLLLLIYCLIFCMVIFGLPLLWALLALNTMYYYILECFLQFFRDYTPLANNHMCFRYLNILQFCLNMNVVLYIFNVIMEVSMINLCSTNFQHYGF